MSLHEPGPKTPATMVEINLQVFLGPRRRVRVTHGVDVQRAA